MIEFEIFTDNGTRNINEDSCGASCHGNSFCFVVADGLGGHGGGEVASGLAVDTICNLFIEEGWSDNFFSKAFTLAQKEILEEQDRQHAPSKMKTTAVVLVLHENRAMWAHLGDSRLYLFKNKKIKLRTLDHSVPQMLVLSNEIKESEIRHHPDRNRVLRVMGIRGEDPQFDASKPVRLSGDMHFLLCTDGFWELLDETDMENFLSHSEDLKDWIQNQKSLICNNGTGLEMDNYTCIAVHSKQSGFFGW